MEGISLKINRLGMLRNAGEIKLNNLMIFSGESGLGKSYVATLCHYFFAVLLDGERINRFFEEKGVNYNQMRPSFKNAGTALTFEKKDFEEWLAKDAVKYVGYMINNDKIEGNIEVSLSDKIDSTIRITFAEEMTGLVNNEDTYVRLTLADIFVRMKDNAFQEESPFAFLFRHYLILTLFGELNALEESFVFPPSRGPMLTEEVLPITGMYSEFKECLYRLKRPSQYEKEDINKETQNLFKQILEGEIVYKDNKYYYLIDKAELPISAAAASIRELAPIEQMVRKVELSRTAILIEEPEAHLHPLKQRMMADITGSLVKAGAYLQITTHSDYYLRRINELMLINKLKGRKDFEEIARELGIIPALTIDATKVSAYLLQRRKDGSAEVVEQNLEEGIPFASFHTALRESLSVLATLDKLLSKKNDGN